MRARVKAFLLAALALCAVVAAAQSNDASAQAAALGANGDVEVVNSHNGSAVLSGVLGPGGSLTGTVTISNIGQGTGPFTLALSHLTDTPGTGGGFLSRQLDLDVEEVTLPLAPVTVFHGKLNSLNPTALGSFKPGALHIYRFAVSWVDGAADQQFAGSSMSVQFDWSATSDITTIPKPTPPSPVTPSSPNAPAAIAAPKLTLAMPAKQAVLRNRGVNATAACAAVCTIVGTGYVTASGAARTYKLVPVRLGGPAGKPVGLKLRLPRQARAPLSAALHGHRKPLASITLVATGADGKTARIKRKIRVSG
jgi:hypothetical protein